MRSHPEACPNCHRHLLRTMPNDRVYCRICGRDRTDEPAAAGPSLSDTLRRAQEAADSSGLVIAIGWSTNDVTGERELGYAPAVAASRAFLDNILETVSPSRRKA